MKLGGSGERELEVVEETKGVPKLATSEGGGDNLGLVGVLIKTHNTTCLGGRVSFGKLDVFRSARKKIDGNFHEKHATGGTLRPTLTNKIIFCDRTWLSSDALLARNPR